MKILATILALCWITGCATMQPENVKIGQEPFVTASTTSVLLAQIPPLDQPKITIAVYSFPDLTGQRKPNSKFSLLSTAVPQGSEVWVIQALKTVGNGEWFQVVERGGLDNLVKESNNLKRTWDAWDAGGRVGPEPRVHFLFANSSVPTARKSCLIFSAAAKPFRGIPACVNSCTPPRTQPLGV